MKRVIENLNEMSFVLPEGWEVSTDQYRLLNGQGFINDENYISPEGKVVSLFEVQRDPDEFFEYYQSLVEGHNQKDGLELALQFSISVNGFSFPVYVLKGLKEPVIYIVQIFINCGDCLGCFMFNIDNFVDDKKQIISKNNLFKEVSQILRTVE
ncbi:MAG: hypothetical protein J6A28_02240 [Clostridia bacterium]|nr:hypothetical protein [Clostridia bacterium]